MSPTCKKAVRSIRIIARIHIGHARTARKHGLLKTAAYHLQLALEDRASANLLARTWKASNQLARTAR